MMEFRQLGHTDIKVSGICLGTMTWGQQNTESEGHEQMDYSVDMGVNFLIQRKCMPCRQNLTRKGQQKKLSAHGSKKPVSEIK